MRLLIENLGIFKKILSKIAQCAIIRSTYALKETARYERLNYDYGNELR